MIHRYRAHNDGWIARHYHDLHDPTRSYLCNPFTRSLFQHRVPSHSRLLRTDPTYPSPLIIAVTQTFLMPTKSLPPCLSVPSATGSRTILIFESTRLGTYTIFTRNVIILSSLVSDIVSTVTLVYILNASTRLHTFSTRLTLSPPPPTFHTLPFTSYFVLSLSLHILAHRHILFMPSLRLIALAPPLNPPHS
jgi:hypothetical protein